MIRKKCPKCGHVVKKCPKCGHIQSIDQQSALYKKETKGRIKMESNPNHEPAGSPEGGQFASAGVSSQLSPAQHQAIQTAGEFVSAMGIAPSDVDFSTMDSLKKTMVRRGGDSNRTTQPGLSIQVHPLNAKQSTALIQLVKVGRGLPERDLDFESKVRSLGDLKDDTRFSFRRQGINQAIYTFQGTIEKK